MTDQSTLPPMPEWICSDFDGGLTGDFNFNQSLTGLFERVKTVAHLLMMSKDLPESTVIEAGGIIMDYMREADALRELWRVRDEPKDGPKAVES